MTGESREPAVMLSIEDRLAIHELINLHGHLCDAGAFDRFEEIMTEDVVYDVSDLGGEGDCRTFR